MNNRTDIKIFIASSGELQEERKESIILLAELNKRLPHLHLEPVLFEIDTPSGNFPWKKRIQDGINPFLSRSDIVVVLFYSKVGLFTKEELELGFKQQKKVYLYFKEGFVPTSDAEFAKYGEVKELQFQVERDSAIRYQKYTDVEQYYSILYRDLEKYLDQTYPTQVSSIPVVSSSSNQFVPSAPHPYFAHPYAIARNFTGRDSEFSQITEWSEDGSNPMLVIRAIGGMGKTSLCWKWIQNKLLLDDLNDFKGIVWWSFYDQGLEDFIQHFYRYCNAKQAQSKNGRIDELSEIISLLTNNRFLLILDGFERLLIGYNQFNSFYSNEEILKVQELYDSSEMYDVYQRTPVSPKTSKILQALCVGKSKVLITTRLYPTTIDGLDGVRHLNLKGLSTTDTILFFQKEGIKGTIGDMKRAGAVYGNHPLMLKLLSTAILRGLNPQIDKALSNAFKEGLINKKEPKKILKSSFSLLNSQEQTVALRISVFRSVFTFNAAKNLFPDLEDEILGNILIELDNLGFIMYNRAYGLFDLHPIIRAYLYENLSSKETVHSFAQGYFAAQPYHQIITLSDLEDVIEQFHHLMMCNRYDDAYTLFYEKMADPLLYQLRRHDLCINLTEQLFRDDGEFVLPDSSHIKVRGYILNLQAICYASIGQVTKSTKKWLESISVTYQLNDEFNLSIDLKNLGSSVFMDTANFLTTRVYLKKAIHLMEKTNSEYTGDGYSLLGRTLIFESSNSSKDKLSAEFYLERALDLLTKANKVGQKCGACLNFTVYFATTTTAKAGNKSISGLTKALEWALMAMKYAEEYRQTNYPNIFDFRQAYEAISVALLAILKSKQKIEYPNNRVLFFDEAFTRILYNFKVTPKNQKHILFKCIYEGLSLSRQTNELHAECRFSLLSLQTEWVSTRKTSKISLLQNLDLKLSNLKNLGEKLKYRVFLADLHFFWAEILIEMQEITRIKGPVIPTSNIATHLELTQYNCIDNSEITDIFRPPNTDKFYLGIKEYQMLKKGTSNHQKIKFGYYQRWLRAEELKQSLYINFVVENALLDRDMKDHRF